MRKTLLLISILIVLTFSGKSQITITTNDMPVPGIFAFVANDTVFTGISAGNSGVNQTWNLTNLLNQKGTTEFFVNPSGVPGSSNFPGSNLADTTAGGDYIFYQSGSSSINVLGFYSNMGSTIGYQPVKFTPSSTYLTLPCTYLTTFNNTYSLVAKFPYASPPVDSVKMISHVSYSSVIDGWGIITTPSYTSIPCLRQKYTAINIDSSFYHMGGFWVSSGAPTTDTSIDYNWFGNGIKFPIASIGEDGAGNVTSAKYLLGFSTSIQVNSDGSNNKITIYPNPVAENLYISGIKQASNLLVYDITGKLLFKESLTNEFTSLNISAYKAGLYYYRLVDLSGSIIGKGKFEIAK